MPSPQGVEVMSRVLFLEYGTMRVVHTFLLEACEQALACISVELAGVENIVVGTAITARSELDPSNGRILVFGIKGKEQDITSSGDICVDMVAEKDVRGGVFSLADLQGKIVAGIGSKVSGCQLMNKIFCDGMKSRCFSI